jgi:hypothetical protein
LYSVEPYGVLTMKQSYASAGKAPRRRVHSLSGIADEDPDPYGLMKDVSVPSDDTGK